MVAWATRFTQIVWRCIHTVQGKRARLPGTPRCVLQALFTCLLLAIGALQVGTAYAEDTYLDPKVAFVFSAAMHAPDRVDVHFKIAPGYYMYRERFKFAAAPQADRLGEPVYPHGLVKYDPTFERDLEVYHNQVTISVPVKPGALLPQTLSITGQGCADAGLCYPPMTTRVTLTPVAQGYTLSGQGVVASVPAARDETPPGTPPLMPASAGSGQQTANPGLATSQDTTSSPTGESAFGMTDVGLAAFLTGAGWFKIIGLCLLLGILLTFTPCVLPMVPILLAVIAGDTPHARKSRARGLGLAATYVLGVSVVYTILGIAAGLAGAGLAAWLQTPWVLGIFAVLLVLLALSMFDVFTIQAPVGVQSALSAKIAKIPGGHFGGSFIIGMLSALVVGPCVAAPLAGVLLFISQTGDVTLGGSALFALAWGQGVLLLVVGATSGALLPKAGPWMDGVKRLFGMLLIATAWWMINPLLPQGLAIVGWALIALCSALLMGAFTSSHNRPAPASALSGHQVALAAWRTIGLALAFWAALQIVGLLAGGRDMLRPLAPFTQTTTSPIAANGINGTPTYKTAFTRIHSVAELDNLLANTTRPVMLDFYADWCVSCIEMERFTFTNPQVAQRMSGMTLVQADVTQNTPDDQALLKRFSLFGPPGIIFFNAKGQQLPAHRVIGFKNATDFAAILQKVAAAP